MPDIRYVCLSDMHLGEDDSLLTSLTSDNTGIDPLLPSPVMLQLVECLKFLISKNENDQKPILILNGDILELALSNTNQAAMVFKRFIELIMPPDKAFFQRIIYVPGNHDHHIWETARETQYVEYISKFDPEDYLPIPWHTTKIFVENDPEPVPSYFLTRLVKRYPHLEDFKISVAYPNFGLVSENGHKCVIFHHGHFIESIYHLMSTLKDMLLPDHPVPSRIYDIEAENFAWIDFFWSTMGRSGEIGGLVESIYEKMRDLEHFKELLSTFADNLAERYDLPGKGDWMEARILKVILYYLVDKMAGRERTYKDKIMSPDVENGLQVYMEKPLMNQIQIEYKKDIPTDVSFILGHTHKPFQKDMNFKGYSQNVKVYNTGGWVVDTIEHEPVFGGAVVLVDENLDVITLRMFNQAANKEEYSVRVEEATHAGENPFFQRISGLVDPSSDPWKEFSTIVAWSVDARMKNLRDKIKKRD